MERREANLSEIRPDNKVEKLRVCYTRLAWKSTNNQDILREALLTSDELCDILSSSRGLYHDPFGITCLETMPRTMHLVKSHFGE